MEPADRAVTATVVLSLPVVVDPGRMEAKLSCSVSRSLKTDTVRRYQPVAVYKQLKGEPKYRNRMLVS